MVRSLGLAVLVATYLYSVSADCPDDFVRHGESCYKVFTISTTWAEAEVFCEAFMAELAEISSPAEQHFIENYLAPYQHLLGQDVWIGGTDILVEGSFKWSLSGDPLGYTAWAPGEPRDLGQGEDCLALFTNRGFKWNDAPCESKQMFICEIP